MSLCSDISRQYSTLTLRVEKTFKPWRWGQYVASKDQNLIIHCYSVIFEKIGIISYTTMKTSKFPKDKWIFTVRLMLFLCWYRQLVIKFENHWLYWLSCNVIVQGKSTVSHTVAAQLLIPVVLALVYTVLTACCQLGSAPVTTISRCALHLLSEWEERKKMSCGRPWWIN